MTRKALGRGMRSLTADAPTIYQALRRTLGREPNHAELKADVRRILREAYERRASTALDHVITQNKGKRT